MSFHRQDICSSNNNLTVLFLVIQIFGFTDKVRKNTDFDLFSSPVSVLVFGVYELLPNKMFDKSIFS